MVIIWDSILAIYDSMRLIYLDIIQALNLELTVFGENFTLLELMFGSGLIILLAYMITKFLL